jgi:hypothetical protein
MTDIEVLQMNGRALPGAKRWRMNDVAEGVR